MEKIIAIEKTMNILKEVEKSNLSTNAKMVICLVFGNIDGRGLINKDEI